MHFSTLLCYVVALSEMRGWESRTGSYSKQDPFSFSFFFYLKAVSIYAKCKSQTLYLLLVQLAHLFNPANMKRSSQSYENRSSNNIDGLFV